MYGIYLFSTSLIMCSLFWKVIGKVRFRQNAYTSQESLYLKAICAFMQALSNLCTTTTRNFQKLPSYTFHVFLFTFFFAAAHFHLRWPLASPFSEPKFLGCTGYQIFLSMVLRYPRFARERAPPLNTLVMSILTGSII